MGFTTASLIFGGGLGATTVLTAGQLFVGRLVFAGISTLVTSALTPKPKMPDLGSVGGNIGVSFDPIGASEIVYGQIRKGGVKTYHETTGDGKYYHYFLTLAMHEVEEIGTIYVNDNAVTLDSSGFVTSDGWNSKILVKKFTGTSTQNIYSSLSGLSNGPSNITSTFKGQGVACIYVRLEYDRDVFQSGQPLVTAVVKGKKVYDPRKDSTSDAYQSALGTSTHRTNDASTWEYSSNPALAMRDYLTSSQGVVADHSQIDDEMIADAADDCANTGVADAEENSFEVNGTITTGDTKLNNLNSLIKCLNGTLFWAQGKFRLVAGAYHAPTISDAFTLDDVRSPISIQTRHSRRDLVNTVRGTFTDKDNRWIAGEFPQIQLADMTEDNNVESVLDVEFPLVTKSAQAQRLAKQILYTSREQITLSAKFSAKAYQVQVGDTIKLTMSRYGWTNKVFLVKGWKATGGDGTPIEVELTLQETSSTAYQWSVSADEYSAITANNTSLGTYAEGTAISNLAATTSATIQPDGTVISKMAVTWTAASGAAVVGYEVEWKGSTDTKYSHATTTDNSYLLTNLRAGESYTIRVRSFTHRDNRGAQLTLTKAATGDTLAPKAPTGPTKSGGYRTATIGWTAPTQNTNNTGLVDLAGYKVYRSTTNTIPSNFQAKVNATTFTDGGLSDATTYYYWVKAFDYTGNDSSALSIGAVTTQAELTDGEDGAAGAAGERGAGRWYVSVSSLPTTSSGADTEFTAEIGDPVDRDQAWFYTGTLAEPDEQSVWIYTETGDTWTEQTEVIHGSLLVDGTITSNAIETGGIATNNLAGGAVNTAAMAPNAATTSIININSPLDFNQPTSAILGGRNSLSDFETTGFYIGRTSSDGSTADGFQLSHTSTVDSEVAGIVHDGINGFQILNPVFRANAGTNTPNTVKTTQGQTITLSKGVVHTVAIVGGGGGGGGASNEDSAKAGTYHGTAGGAGGSTTATLTGASGYSGTTVFTASGGSGGARGEDNTNHWNRGGGYTPNGPDGENAGYGAGGEGGAGVLITQGVDRNGNDGSDATSTHYGAGGGGGSPASNTKTNEIWWGNAGGAGGAGQVITAEIDLTSATTDGILTLTTVGSGGSGGTGYGPLSGTTSGDGGDGATGAMIKVSALDKYGTYSMDDLFIPVKRDKAPLYGYNSSSGATISSFTNVSNYQKIIGPYTDDRYFILNGGIRGGWNWQSDTWHLTLYSPNGTSSGSWANTQSASGQGVNYSTSSVTTGAATPTSGNGIGDGTLFTYTTSNRAYVYLTCTITGYLKAGDEIRHVGQWSNVYTSPNSLRVIFPEFGD